MGKIKIFFGAVILVLIAVLLVSYSKYETSKSALAPKPSLLEARESLVPRYQIKFPQIGSQTSVSALPTALADFIPETSTKILLQRITYSDGEGGYRAEFTVPQNINWMINFIRPPISANSWRPTNAAGRSSITGFVEAKSDEYSMRLNYEAVSDTETIAVMQVIEN